MVKKLRCATLGLCFALLTASCEYLSLTPTDASSGDAGNGDAGNGDAGSGSGALRPIRLELVAGHRGGSGHADGTGAAARFNSPAGVAVDRAGNVYIADQADNTIRKITAAGVVTTLAGTARMIGSADGTGGAARFRNPLGVAVDGAGNVYVADQGNHTIRRITAAGVVTTLAGTAGMAGSADGTGAAARFSRPAGVAVDSARNVYVTDTGNHTVRRVSAAGAVTTLAGTAGMTGSVDGTGAAARFSRPAGVAVDSAGRISVIDEHFEGVIGRVRRVTAAGVVTTLRGDRDVATFRGPAGVTVDHAGNVYVAEEWGCAISKFAPDGAMTTLAGYPGVAGSASGTGDAARFKFPAGVAIDSDGNIFVADTGNSTVRRVTAAGVVTTLAGAAGRLGSADGQDAAARFNFPAGLAVDSAGNIYVADQGNATLRKVTAARVVTTLAGTARKSGNADGAGAAARLDFPAGVTVDSSGNMYVADQDNATIRKVTPDGIVTTLAGAAGMYGSADGTGAAARFQYPAGVAVDGAGNVYVADQGNATIRKVTAAGMVTTLAGTAGMLGSADGVGAAARFKSPTGVALDSAGNVYVADTGNSTLRKITAGGVVTTMAGAAGGLGSADGVGGAARFKLPTGVAVDSAGNVYVADTGNSTLRKVTPAGVTTTLAGTPGISGILLGETPRLASPQYLAIVNDSIIVSDTNAVLLLRHGAQ